MTVKIPFYMRKPFYYSVFVVMMLFLSLAVALYFKTEKRDILQQNIQELKNITLLKSQQISDWFNDELNDAWEIGRNTSFVYNEIALTRQSEEEFSSIISNYLKGVAVEHDYSIIFLTDSVGNILYSSSKLATSLDPIANIVFHQSLPGRASTTDVFRAEDGSACIDFVTSLDIETDDYPAPVFMVMRIDPEMDLYPWVEQTYLNTSTQIVLLRKNSHTTEVLSNLKDANNPNESLIDADTSTFQTLLSKIEGEGSFNGLDYRGQQVVGYAVRIEHTSWFVLSKTDEAEVLHWYYHKMFLIIPIFLLGIILTALFILYYDTRRSNRFYRSYGAEQAKFKTTIYSIGDAVIITDKQGTIKNMNPVAEKTTGWKEAEAIGKPLTVVFNIINEATRNRVESPVKKVLEQGVVVELANHTLLIRRDGSEIPILDSGAPIVDENNEISGVVLVFRDQSAERQRQASIEGRELNYRRMFISNPQPMIIYNVDNYQILEVNDAMVKMYGYSYEEFLQMDVKALRPEEEIPHFVQQMKKEASNVLHMGEVWKHRLKNGETIFVEISSHQITYNKQPARHVLIINVSQRLAAEEALMQSEQKFRLLFENHSAKKFIIDPKTAKIEDANLAASKFYGWSREEFHGMDLSVINLLSMEEIQQFIKKIESAAETTFEFKHRKRDGTVFDAEVFSSNIVTDNKIMLHSIVQDVTERKQAEEKVNLLIRSINQSPVGIVIADELTITTYVNPYVCEMTGYSEEELLGNAPFLLRPVSEPLYSEIQSSLKRGEEWKGEFEDKKKNGEKYWKNVAISVVRNSNGGIANYVLIQEDITLRRKILYDLIESQQKAEESDRLKSAFLANMSHEIRTPMNGVLGFMDLLQDPDLTSDEREEYMAIVRSSGNRLLSTINDIIDISKIESEQVVLNISQFNINNLLKRLLLFFNAEANNENLKLILDSECNETAATIRTDMSKVESIYTNLIKNAVKFTDKGHIAFGCSVDNDKLHGFVEDTGRGIPGDRQDTVFNRFVQADTSYSRAYEGSGLGLSITKAFVEMLGGTIELKSKVGEGTRFDFVIDVKPGDPSILSGNSDAFKELPDEHEAIILVAEDDEVSYIFLTKLLAGKNLKFIHAHNGKEAVEFCRTNPEINLVMMDIKMPIMDGYEATRIIKSFRPELPIVVVTAFAFSEDRNKALTAGCDEYISKPLNRNKVIEIIDRYI
jgi:PAS domain S-box-containing protein